jgi:hypothetical protein
MSLPVNSAYVGQFVSGSGADTALSRQQPEASGADEIDHSPYVLAERILDRREKALQAGFSDAAERLLQLAWEAYDRAQLAGSTAVVYVA